ncbi:LamG-like jellyroll fold domain-containing protein [Verrucomicrobiota bacterium]
MGKIACHRGTWAYGLLLGIGLFAGMRAAVATAQVLLVPGTHDTASCTHDLTAYDGTPVAQHRVRPQANEYDHFPPYTDAQGDIRGDHFELRMTWTYPPPVVRPGETFDIVIDCSGAVTRSGQDWDADRLYVNIGYSAGVELVSRVAEPHNLEPGADPDPDHAYVRMYMHEIRWVKQTYTFRVNANNTGGFELYFHPDSNNSTPCDDVRHVIRYTQQVAPDLVMLDAVTPEEGKDLPPSTNLVLDFEVSYWLQSYGQGDLYFVAVDQDGGRLHWQRMKTVANSGSNTTETLTVDPFVLPDGVESVSWHAELTQSGNTNSLARSVRPVTFPVAHRPVLVVPGIAGTYVEGLHWEEDWNRLRGLRPDILTFEAFENYYYDLMHTFANVNATASNKILVIAAVYDWRLDVAPFDGVHDGVIGGLTAGEDAGVMLGNSPDSPNANFEICHHLPYQRVLVRWNGLDIYGNDVDTTWHFMAFVRDDTGRLMLHFDRSPPSPGAVVPDLTFTTPHRIGADNSGAGAPFFHGALDELMIFNRALSYGEIDGLRDR